MNLIDYQIYNYYQYNYYYKNFVYMFPTIHKGGVSYLNTFKKIKWNKESTGPVGRLSTEGLQEILSVFEI